MSTRRRESESEQRAPAAGGGYDHRVAAGDDAVHGPPRDAVPAPQQGAGAVGRRRTVPDGAAPPVPGPSSSSVARGSLPNALLPWALAGGATSTSRPAGRVRARPGTSRGPGPTGDGGRTARRTDAAPATTGSPAPRVRPAAVAPGSDPGRAPARPTGPSEAPVARPALPDPNVASPALPAASPDLPAVPVSPGTGIPPAGPLAGRSLSAAAAGPDPRVAELVVAALSTVTAHSVVVLDRDLRYRAVAGNAHGHPPFGAGALVDRSARDVLPAGMWATVEPLFRDALRGRTRVTTMASIVGAAPVEVTCSPVVADGEILGVVAVSREAPVSEVIAEAPADELVRVFGLTFDHSPICQALLSSTGGLVRVNRAFCALLGVHESELVGHDIRSITDPRDHGIELGWMARLRTGELEHYALPCRLLHADGHVIRVHVRLSAARAADGTLSGFVAQLLDLHN